MRSLKGNGSHQSSFGNENAPANQRCFYYQKPKRPNSQEIDPCFKTSSNQNITPSLDSSSQSNKKLRTKKRHNVGIQTMYRDIEVQTDPYSPDYVIDDSQQQEIPDIFAYGLHELSYKNKQLPAGLNEIRAVEHIQNKENILKYFAQSKSGNDVKQRQKILEKQEIMDWEYREDLITKEHEKRLALIQKEFKKRNQEIEDEKKIRIEITRKKQEKLFKCAQEKLNQKKIKHSRKLKLARSRLLDAISCDGSNLKNDVISSHANFGSQLYAPIRRMGNEPIVGPQCEVKDILTTEKCIESYVENMELNIKSSQECLRMNSQQQRNKKSFGDNFQMLDNMLNSDKKAIDLKINSSNASGSKKFQATQRPVTPKMSYIPNSDENSEISFLQALLRGRCEQLRIKEKVEQNKLLINEIREIAKVCEVKNNNNNNGIVIPREESETNSSLHEAQNILVTKLLEKCLN